MKYRLPLEVATRFILLALCVITGGMAAADAPQETLEALGYGKPTYTLLFAWEERCLGGRGALIQGYRLAPRGGGAPFDLYTDQEGQPLDAQELRRLGVRAKDWRVRSITRDAVTARTGKALRPSPTPTPLPRPPRGMTLAPVNVARALAEDAAGTSSHGKGVQRTGVMRQLLDPVGVVGARANAGDWQRLGDGRNAWSLEFTVPDALGLRIHFATLEAPGGARLIVYNSDRPDEAYGPLPLRSGLWTPTCFGERVTVELLLPAGTAVDGVRIEIDKLTCRYRGFDFLAKQGDCNNDLACEPEWRATGLAIGGIGSVGTDGDIWCTGTLLVDEDRSTDIPYFLTANHCVPSASEADSAEVYWLYETPFCEGTPPDPATVPRSNNGAEYLAGSHAESGTDFSLLRLREAPPAGITYLGFDSAGIANGTDVVCIHHPRGDFKRITFGRTVMSGSPAGGFNPMQPYTRFLEVLWSEGTTEPGSSGSPLMLADSARIIGQLWGGRASCSLPAEPDYYGRFDVSHPILEQWLGQAFSPLDLNSSGRIDAADVQLVVNAALNPVGTAMDLDGSGRVDARDVQLIVHAVLNNL